MRVSLYQFKLVRLSRMWKHNNMCNNNERTFIYTVISPVEDLQYLVQ